MKRIKFQLPDEVYYQFQSMAGKERQDTDEFIKQMVLDKVKYDDDEDDEQVESPRDLNQMVLDWDWPGIPPKDGTIKLENVTGVVKEMADGCDFSEATSRRAEEAREEDPSRSASYRSSVRSDCTSTQRGVAHGVEEFKKEVDEMLESHNNVCGR